jgi:hypothetical protein
MMNGLFLNVGCGNIILPCEQPMHHSLMPAELYDHPNWVNADKVATGPGVEDVDVFTYPWPWMDQQFSGALLGHIVEHIPHDPVFDLCWSIRKTELEVLQDGWFVFFSELWRVLKTGAVAHIIVPHSNSDGALADPTHRRYVLPQTFGYFKNDEGAAQRYNIGSSWDVSGVHMRITEPFAPFLPAEGDDDETLALKEKQLSLAAMTQVNVAYEFAVSLTRKA